MQYQTGTTPPQYNYPEYQYQQNPAPPTATGAPTFVVVPVPCTTDGAMAARKQSMNDAQIGK